MADLKEAEARILKQFLDDPNGRIALKVFFISQMEHFDARCQVHMRQYNMPMAQEAAYFSSAFKNGFTWLEDFSREQSNRFSEHP